MKNFPSEILSTHENYFLEPLYCAERAWAQSMAIKEEERNGVAGGGKKKSASRLRADRIKRMKKAVSYAVMLEELTVCTKGMPVEEGEEEQTADMPVDEHTRMEAKAYAAWMKGNLAMEQEDWKTARDEYQSAFTFCENIASSSSGDTSEENKMQQLELQDFFTTRANNVIAPLLKYCMYELQEKGIATDSTMGDVNKSLQSSTVTTSGSTIEFRENSITIESKDIKMALLKVSDLKKEWEEEKNNNNCSTDDAKFMALLNGYDDVISLTNQESKQLANLKAGPAVNAKKFQFVNIMAYAKYQKLKLVMGRNEAMVNGILKRKSKKSEVELKHCEEVTHLYDALLQDARAVASLPGGGSVDDFAGDATGPEVEDEFLLEAKANILRLRSLRCYYLAKMHASPLVGKYSQAVTLLDQAESLANEALEEIGACDQMEHRDELLERLEKVAEEMKGEKCRVFAMSYLSKTGPSKSSLPLLSRLHDYDIPANPTYVTDVPPKLEPIACKPSFFDVALNYVSDYPVDELERLLEAHGEKAGTSSGLLGWFRRG